MTTRTNGVVGCAAIDGLPMAIELAAVRRESTAEQILDGWPTDSYSDRRRGGPAASTNDQTK